MEYDQQKQQKINIFIKNRWDTLTSPIINYDPTSPYEMSAKLNIHNIVYE